MEQNTKPSAQLYSHEIILCISGRENLILNVNPADSANVDSNSAKMARDVLLEYPSISQKENIVSAFALMKKAITLKESSYSRVQNYEYKAYNKCVIRENNGIGFGTGSYRIDFDAVKESFNLLTGAADSLPMKIRGIYEHLSRGYFEQPDNYKEIIEAKKTHNTLPSSVASLLGARRIQNLYLDEIKFYNNSIPGPLSPAALTYYRFDLQGKVQFAGMTVLKVHFEPQIESDPGLIGYLYIQEETGIVLEIAADLNRVGNIGGAFKKISVMQNFGPLEGGIYLPIDYHVSIESGYLGITRADYELSSIMYDYRINEGADNDFAGKAVVTVLPEAERIDSSFWKSRKITPYTSEELTTLALIDSQRSASGSFLGKVTRILSPQYRLNDQYSVSGPFGIYQFNHVEGSVLYFSASGNNLLNKTLDTRVMLSDGFSDKRFKERLLVNYFPEENRTLKMSFDVYHRLATLFSSSDSYSALTSTILSLWSRYDFRNYYYTKGYNIGVEKELFHFLSVSAEYDNHTDNSAYTNTFFSLFGNRRNNRNNNTSTTVDSVNTPIYEARLNTLSLGFNFDFRDFTSDNNINKKVSQGNSFVTFGAGVQMCDPKLLKSSIGYVSWNFNVFGEINTFRSAVLGFKINGIYSNGPVPYQMQYALPGNISATGRDYTLRTAGVRNMFGDQAFVLNLEHNFREEAFRFLSIRSLQNVSFSVFFNAALKNMSDKSAAIMPVAFTTYRSPLYETGFSFGYPSIPARLEFAWRLTHIERSSFRFGINTSIL